MPGAVMRLGSLCNATRSLLLMWGLVGEREARRDLLRSGAFGAAREGHGATRDAPAGLQHCTAAGAKGVLGVAGLWAEHCAAKGPLAESAARA